MYMYVCMYAQLFRLCLILCDSTDCSPLGSSVLGILQVKILDEVAMPSSRVSSWPRDWTCISWISSIAGRFFIAEPPGKPKYKVYTDIYIYTYTYILCVCVCVLVSASDSWHRAYKTLLISLMIGMFLFQWGDSWWAPGWRLVTRKTKSGLETRDLQFYNLPIL